MYRYMKAENLRDDDMFIYEGAEYAAIDVQDDESAEDEEGNPILGIYVEGKYFDGYNFSTGYVEFLLDPEEEIEIWRR